MEKILCNEYQKESKDCLDITTDYFLLACTTVVSLGQDHHSPASLTLEKQIYFVMRKENSKAPVKWHIYMAHRFCQGHQAKNMMLQRVILPVLVCIVKHLFVHMACSHKTE